MQNRNNERQLPKYIKQLTTCSLVVRGITQSIITIPVFVYAWLFIGSTIGASAYSAMYKTYISFCIDSGFTMFGIVDQDYQLPLETMEEIGIHTFEYEKFQPESFGYQNFEFKT